MEVTAILKDISSKDHTYFFAQLRSEAKEGPFDKVKVRQGLFALRSDCYTNWISSLFSLLHLQCSKQNHNIMNI